MLEVQGAESEDMTPHHAVNISLRPNSSLVQICLQLYTKDESDTQ